MKTAIKKPETLKLTEAERIRILDNIHKSLKVAMKSGCSKEAIKWIQERKLSPENTGACYNSGKNHRFKDQTYKEELEKIGFLTRCEAPANNGKTAYRAFGKFSIIFPLKNKDNQVINFYSIGIYTDTTAYLNEDGIYPKYPNATTEKLYIVPTALDAATILESTMLDENQAVISLFDGKLKPQHIQAITALTHLKEIVWINYGKPNEQHQLITKPIEL